MWWVPMAANGLPQSIQWKQQQVVGTAFEPIAKVPIHNFVPIQKAQKHSHIETKFNSLFQLKHT